MHHHRAHRRRRLAAACLAALCALALDACASPAHPAAPATIVSAGPTDEAPPGALTLDTPFAKPGLVLTDQDGKRYDLVTRTKSRPLLLYFGYTHCPDVCPTTMADLAGAIARLPPTTPRPAVVFVTTDPARDTPARLKEWLHAIDPGFVGLTGDFTTIQKAARGLGIAVSPAVTESDGSVTVSHGAEVVAFSPRDDRAHLIFPSGTSEAAYTAALPAITAGAAR